MPPLPHHRPYPPPSAPLRVAVAASSLTTTVGLGAVAWATARSADHGWTAAFAVALAAPGLVTALSLAAFAQRLPGLPRGLRVRPLVRNVNCW